MRFAAIMSLMLQLFVGIACASGQATLVEQKTVYGGQSEQMFRKQITVYPKAEHDSWTETYNNPKLDDWFLNHRKSGPSK